MVSFRHVDFTLERRSVAKDCRPCKETGSDGRPFQAMCPLASNDRNHPPRVDLASHLPGRSCYGGTARFDDRLLPSSLRTRTGGLEVVAWQRKCERQRRGTRFVAADEGCKEDENMLPSLSSKETFSCARKTEKAWYGTTPLTGISTRAIELDMRPGYGGMQPSRVRKGGDHRQHQQSHEPCFPT